MQNPHVRFELVNFYNYLESEQAEKLPDKQGGIYALKNQPQVGTFSHIEKF